MNYDDPAAYEGLELHARETATSVFCPKCRGYGKWIYARNPEPGAHAFRNTAECIKSFRCPGPHHFMRFCIQCNGWGVVAKDSIDATCIHVYKYKSTLGRCWTRHACEKCGKEIDIDSSG